MRWIIHAHLWHTIFRPLEAPLPTLYTILILLGVLKDQFQVSSSAVCETKRYITNYAIHFHWTTGLGMLRRSNFTPSSDGYKKCKRPSNGHGLKIIKRLHIKSLMDLIQGLITITLNNMYL
jgi:hypothetical protein